MACNPSENESLSEGNEYVFSNGSIRTNLATEEDWRAWLEKFEVASMQKFIVKKTIREAER